MAGNQFSVPLIDFLSAMILVNIGWESVLRPPDRLPIFASWRRLSRWESVLRPPDRLPVRGVDAELQLGISSPSP